MRASYSGTAQRARLFSLQPLIHTLFAKYVPALQPQNIDASERETGRGQRARSFAYTRPLPAAELALTASRGR